MLLPDSMEVRICVPYNSRSTAWASFDGRGRVELKRAFTAPLIGNRPTSSIQRIADFHSQTGSANDPSIERETRRVVIEGSGHVVGEGHMGSVIFSDIELYQASVDTYLPLLVHTRPKNPAAT